MSYPIGGAALPALVLLASLALGSSSTRDTQSPPPDPSEGELRLPAPIVFKGGDQGPVIFDHSTHSAFTENNCQACHIRLFKILTPSRHTSHQEMEAGRSCGGCHNGEEASDFKDPENCDTCHAGHEDSEPSSDAPFSQALLIRQGENSPGPVLFKHATHQGPKMSCSRCHPALFARTAGSTDWNKENMLEGESCGACHEGETAFGLEDGEHCQRCHAEENRP